MAWLLALQVNVDSADAFELEQKMQNSECKCFDSLIAWAAKIIVPEPLQQQVIEDRSSASFSLSLSIVLEVFSMMFNVYT